MKKCKSIVRGEVVPGGLLAAAASAFVKGFMRPNGALLRRAFAVRPLKEAAK